MLYVPTAVYMAVAHMLIFLGVSIINGQFLPSLFQPIYDQSNIMVRSFVVVMLLMWPANAFVGKGFEASPSVAYAGMAMFVAVVLATFALVLLVEGIKPNIQTMAAMAGTCACAVWFAKALYS